MLCKTVSLEYLVQRSSGICSGASWMPPCGVVRGTSHWDDLPGRPRTYDHVSLWPGNVSGSLLTKCVWTESLCLSAQTAASAIWPRIAWKKIVEPMCTTGTTSAILEFLNLVTDHIRVIFSGFDMIYIRSSDDTLPFRHNAYCDTVHLRYGFIRNFNIVLKIVQHILHMRQKIAWKSILELFFPLGFAKLVDRYTVSSHVHYYLKDLINICYIKVLKVFLIQTILQYSPKRFLSQL